MKKIMIALSVAALTACSTVNYKEQIGTVEIQVEAGKVLDTYEANLADFYQVMQEGLMDTSMAGFESLKSEFLDTTLVACQQDEDCQMKAYESHFAQLHKYTYKNDLSNVEGIYIESAKDDQHLIEVNGFYSFVGENHERLVIFVDDMTVDRNSSNNPYGLERVESIDAILYRQNLGKAAEFKAIGIHPVNKIVRLNKTLELNDLMFSIDISEIEFTDFTIGISVHLAGQEYEISTFRNKILDIRPVEKNDQPAPSLY